ncbi:hypothetical protein [Haliangium ochraceum]|uniref:DUF6312 domain-containing protein n=1 Tax=Haliangium ochraceum TaxID=80816 RepID=UPI003B82E1C9
MQRVTVVSLSGPNRGESTTLFKKKNKKRKVSKWLRPMEKGQRRMLRASEAFSTTSLSRHNRSNSKRKNGWIRDVGKNQMKASRKAFKKLRMW